MNGYMMPTKDSIGDSLDETSNGDFWMVWNVNGRAPAVPILRLRSRRSKPSALRGSRRAKPS